MRDSFGRTITYLRLSVTDLCNLRCRYCFYADEVSKQQQTGMGVMSAQTAELLLEEAFRCTPSSRSAQEKKTPAPFACRKGRGCR